MSPLHRGVGKMGGAIGRTAGSAWDTLEESFARRAFPQNSRVGILAVAAACRDRSAS